MTSSPAGVETADGPTDGDGNRASNGLENTSAGSDDGRQVLVETGGGNDGCKFSSPVAPEAPEAFLWELQRRAPPVPPIAGGLDEMLLRLRQVQWRSGDLHLTSLDGDDGGSPAIEGYLDFCDFGATPTSSDRWSKGRRTATLPAAMSPLGGDVARPRSAKAIMGSPRTAESPEPRLPPSTSASGFELARGSYPATVTRRLGKSAHARMPPVPRGRSQRAEPECSLGGVDRGHSAGAVPVASSQATASLSCGTDEPGMFRRYGGRRDLGGTSGPLDGAFMGPFYDIPGRHATMEGPPIDSEDRRTLTGIDSGLRMELVTTDSTHTTAAPRRSVDRNVSNSGRPGLASRESFLQYDVEDQELSPSPSTVRDFRQTTATASPNPRFDGDNALDGSGATLTQRYKSLVSKNGAKTRLGLDLEAVRRAPEEGPGGGELDSARNSRNRRPGSSSLSGESSDAPQGTHKASRSRLRETRHTRALSDPTTVRSPRVPQGQKETADSVTETAVPHWRNSDGKGERRSKDGSFETVPSWPLEINSYPPSASKYAHPLGPGWQPKWGGQISQQQQCKVYEASLGLQPVRNIHRKSITTSGPLPEGSLVGSETGLFKQGTRKGARVRRLLRRLFWCPCPGRKNQVTAGEDEQVTNSIFYEGVDEGLSQTGSGISTAGYARRQKFMMRMIEESRLE